MKVGNLHFFRVCGCFDIVFGPHPCCSSIGSLIIVTLFTGMFLLMSTSINSSYLRSLAHTGILANVLLFISLLFSSPGIPK